MAAPVGLSGSVPEPRHPETTDPEPVAAQTEPGEPVAAEAAAAEPVAAETEATEPIAAQTGVTEPIAAETGVTDPVAAGAGTAEPVGQADEESIFVASDPDTEPADTEPAPPTNKARRTSPLTVVGLVVGVIALVGAAVAVLAVVTHGFRPKTIVTYRTAAVFSLQAGDCVNSSPNGLSVTVLSCATPHDAEVFATYSLAGSSWPGYAAVQQEAGNGCMSRVAGYVNPAFANAGFAEEYVYPDQAAWQAGVRTVICEIRASSGQLTGSVREGS